MNWFLGKRKTIFPYKPIKMKCIMCDKIITKNYRIDGTVSLNNKCDKCRKRFSC